MIELYLSKVTESSESEQAGKLYARVSYKETMNVQDMAHHMAEHNTMFSEGSICGILIDFVKCVREMVLMGNTVKIDNLAIFKATVEANGLETMYDADADKVASATIGTLAEGAKTGPAVKVIKLLAQSTGDFTRDELKKDVKLAWTDKTKAEIADAKNAATGGASSGSGTENGGSQNQGGGSETAENFALTITTSGSGSASVTINGSAVSSGSSLNEDDEVEISITPAEGQVPTATINGSSIELTENDGVYTGNFAMPGQASSLVINTGTASSGGGGSDGLDMGG
jgi:predicted histone-like DNA-binding protein